MIRKIVVPTDLTVAADRALEQSIAIASASGSSLTLLHIIEPGIPRTDEAMTRLSERAARIHAYNGLACEVATKEGEVVESIAAFVSSQDYDLMVVGTHGFAGIRQKLFGSEILKLVTRLPVPVMVMQENSPVVKSFSKLVLPVSSHPDLSPATDSLIRFAEIFPVEVHLYSIHKPGFDWPEQMRTNINRATEVFEKHGVHMVRAREEQEGFSTGFARQTIRYAAGIRADAVWMMSEASADYYAFAKDYKEGLLMNDANIPVVCVGGKP